MLCGWRCFCLCQKWNSSAVRIPTGEEKCHHTLPCLLVWHGNVAKTFPELPSRISSSRTGSGAAFHVFHVTLDSLVFPIQGSDAEESQELCLFLALLPGCRAQGTLAKPALSFSLHLGSAVQLHLALITWKTQKAKAGIELGVSWDGVWLKMCLFTPPENLLAKLKHSLKNCSWISVCQWFLLLQLPRCNYKWSLFLNSRECILMSKQRLIIWILK